MLLSIIIPCFNEELRLPITLDKISLYLEHKKLDYEIIVVDNNSTDHTLKIACQYQEKIPNLRVVEEPIRGKGAAVRKGMSLATGLYRFMCDADLSMPINEIEGFLPPNLKSDIGIGYRKSVFGEPPLRIISGKVFNLLVNLFLGLKVRDTQCGFKVFKKEAADFVFSRQTITGWSFDVEILFVAQYHGFSISEIPISWYYDPRSKIKLLRDSLQMFRDVLKIKQNARKGIYS